MNPRGLLAFVSAISFATALAISDPAFNNTPTPVSHGGIVHLAEHLLLKDFGLNASEEYKYFQEPGSDQLHAHYDSRFYKEPVPKEQRAPTLTHIVHSYFDYFNNNGLETWIAHGTLLGWWWNGKIMPWDWDIDTQVSEATLFRLADQFNGTVVQYNTTDPVAEHSYLLDVNPWARQRDRGKGANIIDARWIDMKTGLYIDITGLSRLDKDRPDEWGCKNYHKYMINDIYPLRQSTFENVAAKVPYSFEAVLTDEYHAKALTEPHHHNHTFVPDLHEWISDEVIAAKKAEKEKDGKDDRQYE
ncbi:LicD family-domain-containing protein [Aspergillus californicus]